jgi:hypothetical protein
MLVSRLVALAAPARLLSSLHPAPGAASCVPSLYTQRTTKPRCPTAGCREKLVFSNSVTCKACGTAHCLKHRFEADHRCAGAPRVVARVVPPLPTVRAAPVSRTSLSSLRARAAAQFSDPANSLRGTAARRAAAVGAPSPLPVAGVVGAPLPLPAEGWTSEPCPTCRRRDFADAAALVAHCQGGCPAGSVASVAMRSGGALRSREVCPSCGLRFNTVELLVEHHAAAHEGGSWTSSCQVC